MGGGVHIVDADRDCLLSKKGTRGCVFLLFYYDHRARRHPHGELLPTLSATRTSSGQIRGKQTHSLSAIHNAIFIVKLHLRRDTMLIHNTISMSNTQHDFAPFVSFHIIHLYRESAIRGIRGFAAALCHTRMKRGG